MLGKKFGVTGTLVGYKACPCPSCPDGGTHQCFIETVDYVIHAAKAEHAQLNVEYDVLTHHPECVYIRWMMGPKIEEPENDRQG